MADSDHSAVFTTKAIRLLHASDDEITIQWDDIVAFEAPWHDKRAYREHRSLSIQTTAGWKRIRLGIKDGRFPHVDPLAQVLHSLYPIVETPSGE